MASKHYPVTQIERECVERKADCKGCMHSRMESGYCHVSQTNWVRWKLGLPATKPEDRLFVKTCRVCKQDFRSQQPNTEACLPCRPLLKSVRSRANFIVTECWPTLRTLLREEGRHSDAYLSRLHPRAIAGIEEMGGWDELYLACLEEGETAARSALYSALTDHLIAVERKKEEK